mgnify:FL=1
MDLLDLLVTNNSFKSFSESKPFSEADEEVPDGELNEEEVQDENIEEPIEETDDDEYVDTAGDDTGEAPEEAPEEEAPESNPEEDVADVNASNISLNNKLSESFVTLYTNQSEELDKVKTSNFESSEFGAEFKILIEEYQTTLEILYDYKIRLFETESTAGRMEKLLEFKSIFNNLTVQLNELLAGLNDSETEYS